MVQRPDIHELAREHLEGVSLREIARRLRMNSHTLADRLRATGYSVRTPTESRILANKTREHGPSRAKTAVEYQKSLRRKKLDIIQRFRNENGCSECGEKHPATLDLHHVNGDPHPAIRPRRKDGTSRQGGNRWSGMSFADVEAELEKCIVLCSNCHRIHEWEVRQRQN